MTCVFVAPVGALPTVPLPKGVLEYIESTKNSSLRCARRCAYTLLFERLRAMGTEEVRLSYEPGGKPYIEDFDGESPYEISLSHTDVLVAVCISDAHRVGIDIEGEISQSRAARIEERYLTQIKPFGRELPSEELVLYGDISISPKTPSEALRKWTFAEALGKCCGVGLGVISDIDEAGKGVDFSTAALRYLNKEYFLTLAKIDIK